MDPLIKIIESYEKGILPKNTLLKIRKRFSIVTSGIRRIELSTGIRYPIFYIDPALVLSNNTNIYDNYAILFARTIPFIHNDEFSIIIQISAPLVAYGLKSTVHAILAHEFLHYLDFMNKVSKMKMVSDEITGNFFESIYSDESHLFEPRIVFSDKILVRHIERKFKPSFTDPKLEDKTIKYWLKKNLQKIIVNLDENTIKLSVELLSKTKIQPAFLNKINELEKKSKKYRHNF